MAHVRCVLVNKGYKTLKIFILIFHGNNAFANASQYYVNMYIACLVIIDVDRFTARYALGSYMKQINFVFKVLIFTMCWRFVHCVTC